MALGLVGRKCGMTRLFTEDGGSRPVTVIEIEPHRVVQVKTDETDGYAALQVTTGAKKAQRLNKPLTGHYAKAGVVAGRGLWEFRVSVDEVSRYPVGAEFWLEIFEAGQIVDVQGTSIGKGFAGTVKRHNFNTQDATHGNSRSHRVPGSIGQRQTPGRVFPGMKMCGHMGAATSTVHNLTIVEVAPEKNMVLISGAVPGPVSGDVIIRPASKQRKPAQ